MGKHEDQIEACQSPSLSKAFTDCSEDGSKKPNETVPSAFVNWEQQETQEIYQCQTSSNKFTDAAFAFNKAFEFLCCNKESNYDMSQHFYWCLESVITAGLCSKSVQTNSTSNETHFNLALLAEVAASSTNESGKNSCSPENKNNQTYSGSVEYSRCRRIRNNEACRKSRLRRKQLNAAVKERLLSLTQDNDNLRRKIVSLEEEVTAARNAVLSKLHAHSSQHQKTIFKKFWCSLDEEIRKGEKMDFENAK